MAHSLYGKYRAGPAVSNLSPAFRRRTTRLSSSLADLSFAHGDQLAPQTGGRHQIEVHPPAAAVQLFLLDRVIRYRGGTIAERKEGLRLLRGLILDHFPRLVPRVALTDLPEIPSSGRDLKAMEDRLDSLMSAYVAAHWWFWGRQRNDVLGDAAGGYIVVPRRRTADVKLVDFRQELRTRELLEAQAAGSPIAQFKLWLYEACLAGLAEPNAMTLATAGPDGQPAARVVSLHNIGDEGFTFYTSYLSSKGRELADNPRAALVFHWPEIGRQVRVTGPVEKTGREHLDEYFDALSRPAVLAAWASWQSSQIADRQFLEMRMAKVEQRFGDGDVPAPPAWGGYCLRPETIEFSQNRVSQLHDRLQYSRRAGGPWIMERLAP